jgi:predicted histidine transporter YuiF (NhaC family)
MTIYVMHVLATAGTRIVMVKLGIDVPGTVYLAACTAAGIIAPLCAHVVLDRLGLLPWLGLTGKLGQAGRPAQAANKPPADSAPVHG